MRFIRLLCALVGDVALRVGERLITFAYANRVRPSASIATSKVNVKPARRHTWN